MISCYILNTDGEFKAVTISVKLLSGLLTTLREEGTTDVHLQDKVIEATGIYIPAKGSKVNLIAVNN